MYRTWPNSLRWRRISPPPNPNLVFLSFSNSKFSLLRQKKWKVKTWTCSVAWVWHYFFTNLRLMMHNKRDTNSNFYLFSWTSIWRCRNFQCKVMIGEASLRSRDAIPMFTLSWKLLNQAVELHLQVKDVKMVEVVRATTDRALASG